MQMVDLIEIKRDGGELSTEQIDFFIKAYTAEEIPDYQAAALLMAIYIQGHEPAGNCRSDLWRLLLRVINLTFMM